MTILDAIILGIIQGLTEFLPVSSSGHIEIGQALLGMESLKEQEQLLSVVLHAATALSTIWVFRKDVWEIVSGLFQPPWNDSWYFSVKVLVSMIPAAIVGLFFEDQLDALFEGQLKLVGAMLVVTAILLLLADRAKNTNQEVGFGQALLIGIAQAIAILPGISRSGATISASVLLGVDRAKAARFSFLMVVPLILGKMAKDILDGHLNLNAELALPLAAGFFSAFFTGVLACIWMIQLVKRSKLSWFSLYCLIVGMIAFWAAS